MKIRTKIYIGYFVVVAIGFYFYADRSIQDLKRRYLESVEENLVDSSNVLATMLSDEIKDGKINTDGFKEAFDKIYHKRLSARIYELMKTKVDLGVYVTDARGIVLFDSTDASNVGKDFSKWNDVRLTLDGKYGTRATRLKQDDPYSLVLYVASPLTVNDELCGVLSVCKPIRFVQEFIYKAKEKIIIDCLFICLAVMILGLLVSHWLTRPIQLLTDYALAVRDGKNVPCPKLGKDEIGDMGKAFSEMKDTLEGKKYVEQYVQNLAHELKSPLSAVKGALEILKENPSPDKQAKFLGNAVSETERMRRIVDRMLQLSSLENRKGLKDVEMVDIAEIIRDVTVEYSVWAERKKIRFETVCPPGIRISCERFLLEMALSNLLQNAIDFSQEGAEIKVTAEESNGSIKLTVSDSGPGIPDYALEKIFEKFYSLPRPGSGTKSSGLGLSIVREIVELHNGKVSVCNRAGGGVDAVIGIPSK